MSRVNFSADARGDALEADYVVVGAGTSGLSFIDTLLAEDPDATVILVDRNAKAGGHWTTAYPYVQLHQPSYNYGVNSLALGVTRNSKGHELLARDELASGKRILRYYKRVLKQFKATGRVTCLFSHEYDVGVATPLDGGAATRLVASKKVVTCLSDVRVPSMGPPPFPVADGVTLAPLNALGDKGTIASHDSFVVVGAGKSGVDAVCHLLDEGIAPDKVTWVVSNDVWYFIRDGMFPEERGGYFAAADRWFTCTLKKTIRSAADLFLEWEKLNIVGRVPLGAEAPTIFKGATIDSSQLVQLRSVQAVRLGRITEVTRDEIILEEGRVPLASNELVVDCTAGDRKPGEIFGYGCDSLTEDFLIFRENEIALGPLIQVFNPSVTAAIVAYLEATFEDDATKNSFCFFPSGDTWLPGSGCSGPTAFLGLLYAELKTVAALKTYGPAMNFLLKSRTAVIAPEHHGGMLALAWASFGPMRLDDKRKRFLKRVDDGDFEDTSDSFGLGRKPVAPQKASIKKKTSPKNYPPKSRAPPSSSFACCGGPSQVVETRDA